MSRAAKIILAVLGGAVAIAIVVGVVTWLARATDRVIQPHIGDDGTFNCESVRVLTPGAIQQAYMECVLRKEQIEATNRLAEALERL